MGYSRYRDVGDKTKWIKRRQQNYYGSTMHFYRSLISKDLNEQGFSIFEIKKTKAVNFAEDFSLSSADVKLIEPVQLLFIDSISNEYYLQFNNTIVVQYNKTPPAAHYLFTKIFVQGINNKGFTAYINLVADKVGIDINGAIDEPSSIVFNGFWIYEKMANQLPYNYQPN